MALQHIRDGGNRQMAIVKSNQPVLDTQHAELLLQLKGQNPLLLRLQRLMAGWLCGGRLSLAILSMPSHSSQLIHLRKARQKMAQRRQVKPALPVYMRNCTLFNLCLISLSM